MWRVRAALLVSCALLVLHMQTAAQNSSTSATGSAPAATAPASRKPTAADIAAAKAAGKVWVNLDTGVYHKAGRWYGKTKDGRFMSEADAKKAGYKPAKRN